MRAAAGTIEPDDISGPEALAVTADAADGEGPTERIDRLDGLLSHHPLPTWRVVARPIMILISAFVAWAFFAQLDEVAVATGEVVPKGQVRVIQHLEGGIIEKINVSDGDMVKAGTLLVELNLATGGLNKDELQVRLDTQLLARARLEAETEGKDLKFPEDVAKRRPSQVIAQQRAFASRKREMASTFSVLSKQVRQRELEVQELEAQIRSGTQNLKLARERLKMSKSLLAEGLTPKIEHLQLRAEVQSLEGQIKTLRSSLKRARAAVGEALARLKEAEVRFRRKSQEERVKTEQAIGRLQELLKQATEQGLRRDVKSPIDGIVKNLRYHTIGGVVKPGEPIMEIVPTKENLVIEARLRLTDRGYVNAGQPATIKISTYDFARYGGLEGTVVNVAPDSSTDLKTGQRYYQVVVAPKKTYLGEHEGDLPIVPGMQATVEVHTGKKSVMDYLIRPVLKLKHEAFRER